MYSASIVDKEIDPCFLLIHATNESPRKKAPPLVLFLSISTIFVYASTLHKWSYLQVLPNISQRTKSASHHSFWQMNKIVMGFLFVLGKIEIILSYSQYQSSSIKASKDLCYWIACKNIVRHYLQALCNILAEAKFCKVILPVLSH
jgi:hypothetical protein